MAHDNDEDGLIRRYLLGQLAEDEREQLEEKMMADNELFDRVLLAEDEMVEQYVQGELPESDRAGFEAAFLSTPEGRQQVTFAKALSRQVKDVSPAPDAEELVREEPVANEPIAVRPRTKDQLTEGPVPEERRLNREVNPAAWWRRPVLVPYLAAAAAVIVMGLGIGIWRITSPSEVSKGLTTLAYAYRDQRPFEARISGFNYAPAVTTRGGDQKVDRTARNLAESILLDAVLKHPNAATHHAAGRLYLAEKKFDEAIEQFKEALKVDPNNAQLHSDYGAALLQIGKADRAAAQGKSLEELAQSLEHLSKALELDDSLLEALFNRALCRQEMTLFQQATEDWRTYLRKDPTSKWADEARLHLKSLEERGSNTSQTKEELLQDFLIAYQARDDEKAWSALSRSRARTGNVIIEKLLDAYLTLVAQKQTAQADNNLRMLSYAGDLENQKVGDGFTSDLARSYEQIAPTRGETLERARSLMKSASEKFNQSEFVDAAKCYSQAQRLFEQSGDTCESLFAESWFGNCLLRIPDTRRSLATFERLSQTFEERKYRWLYAQSLNAISDAQSSINEISKALDLANRSMQASEQIEDAGGVLRNLQQLISMNLKVGNYHESLRFSARALEFAYAFPRAPKQIWGCYQDAAFDFYWLGLLHAAFEFQKEALELAIESREPLLKSRSYERLGLIYEKVHNYDEAIKNGRLAQEEGGNIESQSSRSNIIAHSSLRLGFLYNQIGDPTKALESYDQAMRIYEKLGFNIYLYEAHKGKLQSFISVGDVSAAKEELVVALGLFEQYRSKILEEGNRNSFFDAGQGIYDIAAAFAFSTMNDRQQAFNYSEACRARSLLDLTHTDREVVDGKEGRDIAIRSVTQPLELFEIQQRMPEQAQLLQYAVLDDRILMWVVSKDGIESGEKRIASDELGSKVEKYLDLISKPAEGLVEETSTLAKELYEILIGPVEPFLDKHRQVCIVPDKVLNYLSFGSLVAPGSGKYFIEDYTFEVSPSSSIFIWCSEAACKKERRSAEIVLSVGNPYFDRDKFPTLPDLPAAAKEAQEIAACYSASIPLIEDRATRTEVKKEIPRVDVVHLACHYVVDTKSPLLSKLLLTREPARAAEDSDGVLHVSDIYSMKLLRARLVVLSACQTGIERAYRGEGALSIARPFISAGVPMVVASLWPVDSDSTAELMVNFHKHRKQEALPTVEALRKAQLEMLASSEQLHQPYWWASFVVIGGYATY
jgi:CHAT domain-containing protein/Tfp pilus assembly protein PilF